MQSGIHQRSTYKVIDKLLSNNFSSPLELLISLVSDVVTSDKFAMSGGRVWEYDPAEGVYELRHQQGEMEFMNEDTKRHPDEMPVVKQLPVDKVYVTNVEDERGSRIYSLIAVGDTIKTADGPLCKYALAFTAHELTDDFRDTMIVMGSAATTAIRNMRSAQAERRHLKDLDQAWQIQHGLVPEHRTHFAEFDIFGVSIPDSIVGGDYFDYLQPTDDDSDRLGVVVSDAASKGLPAAVQALFVSGALRMAISFQTKISTLIQRLNTLIYDTFPNERFVSLCYAELTHSENGLVMYANAGHCPPLHFIAATGEAHWLQPTGGILGIIEQQKFRVENINMQRGDILVLYTDGITEAQHADGSLYGEDRLYSVISQNYMKTPEQIAHHLLDDVQQFSTGASYSDDRTLIIVKRGTSTPTTNQ